MSKTQISVDNNSIYLGGLPNSATEEYFRRIFSYYGELIDVKIIDDQPGKYYGFVTFRYPESVQFAIGELDCKIHHGSVLRVIRITNGRPEFGQQYGRCGMPPKPLDHDEEIKRADQYLQYRGHVQEKECERDRPSQLKRDSDRSRKCDRSRGHDEESERAHQYPPAVKRAREEFTKMLESRELTSSMKWSKAVSLFENDDRFKAVDKERQELFDTYIQKKEKEEATEFRKFLESCDFIKVNTKWRSIQDRLEVDERCLRLRKCDRLRTFMDYILDLEKEEDHQKEQLRLAECKARVAFRKQLKENVSAGILTAKTRWFDYCAKVKDSPQYCDVASNNSGSTPKDLFEYASEELQKDYHDNKTSLKNAMQSKNIVVLSSWTFEDFKVSLADNVGSLHISEINLKLLFEEMVDKPKEEEAKKRQRLADDFTRLLYNCKEEVTASTSWEECKSLFEKSQEYKSIAEESLAREVFEVHVAHLQEKAKEKERKREEEKQAKKEDREKKEKRKEKEKKEKERDRAREKGKERTKKDDTDNENGDTTETYSHKDDKKREEEKDRKHQKWHQDADDVISDRDEKEDSKRSHRHGSDRKKSRKHSYSPKSDGESRHKKHERSLRLFS